MAHPVILTPQALEDLQSAVRYIARDNPAVARSFGNELIDRALAIGQFPELGRTVPELDQPSVREVVHRGYRIIYEALPGSGAVYVLRFWHGARGTPEIPT
jgi:toxin ParE1/3/4